MKNFIHYGTLFRIALALLFVSIAYFATDPLVRIRYLSLGFFTSQLTIVIYYIPLKHILQRKMLFGRQPNKKKATALLAFIAVEAIIICYYFIGIGWLGSDMEASIFAIMGCNAAILLTIMFFNAPVWMLLALGVITIYTGSNVALNLGALDIMEYLSWGIFLGVSMMALELVPFKQIFAGNLIINGKQRLFWNAGILVQTLFFLGGVVFWVSQLTWYANTEVLIEHTLWINLLILVGMSTFLAPRPMYAVREDGRIILVRRMALEG